MIAIDSEVNFHSLNAALNAAFRDVVPDYGSQSFSERVGISTKRDGLCRTAGPSDKKGGVKAVIDEARRQGKISSDEYSVLTILHTDKFAGDDILIILVKVFDRVNEKAETPITGEFIRDYSIPLWRHGETVDSLEWWAKQLGVSLATVKRRSAEASKLLGLYRTNAYDAAGKVLREKGWIE